MSGKNSLIPRSHPIITPTFSSSLTLTRQTSSPYSSFVYSNFVFRNASVEPAGVESVALRMRFSGELASGVFFASSRSKISATKGQSLGRAPRTSGLDYLSVSPRPERSCNTPRCSATTLYRQPCCEDYPLDMTTNRCVSSRCLCQIPIQ